jgi:hypothetical protein
MDLVPGLLVTLATETSSISSADLMIVVCRHKSDKRQLVR